MAYDGSRKSHFWEVMQMLGRWHCLSWFEVLMGKLNEQPDVITCNASISTYGKAALWQLSIQALAQMDAQRLPDGTITCEMEESAMVLVCMHVELDDMLINSRWMDRQIDSKSDRIT